MGLLELVHVSCTSQTVFRSVAERRATNAIPYLVVQSDRESFALRVDAVALCGACVLFLGGGR